MMIKLYRIATIIAGPLIKVYLNRRLAQGKEHPTRFPERLGHTSTLRPQGKLIWIHGASVGEAISILTVIERLQKLRPEFLIMVTTGTVTSAALLKTRLPENVIHQFIVVDRPEYVKRFLGHWQPDLVLWVESEFWPNLLMQTAGLKIPLVLINGRVSDKSFKSWQRFMPMIQKILNCFTLVMGQSDIDTDRLKTLGANQVKSLGNLKDAAPALSVDETNLSALKKNIGHRSLWLAASTHPGEEQLIARVHQIIAKKIPDLLTIIVPRHAERGPDIFDVINQMDLTINMRSKQQSITPETDIYLADTMGELGIFYRLSNIVFMGKSLIHQGGQNPLEAIKLGKAVVLGPNMDNFKSTAERLIYAGAAVTVKDKDALAAKVEDLLSDHKALSKMMGAASLLAQTENHILENVVDEILSVYDQHQTGKSLGA